MSPIRQANLVLRMILVPLVVLVACERERERDESSAPPDVAAPPADAARASNNLAWKVLKAGQGTVHPKPRDTVEVHYTGWTTNGQMFDSSRKRNAAATFPLDRVIDGWRQAVQLMVVGESRRFWIPEDLAYAGRSGGPPGMLVFDIELLGITPAQVVGDATVKKLSLMTEKLRREFPIPADELDSVTVQRSSETTVEFQKRLRGVERALNHYDRDWRTFFIGRAEGDVAASRTAMAKFLKAERVEPDLECFVFDVRPYRAGGMEILCSAASRESWDYSVIGYMPTGDRLTKGELIAFSGLDAGIPVEGEPLKLRFLRLRGSVLSFRRL